MSKKNEKIVSKVPELTDELIAANEDDQRRWRKLFVAPQTSKDKYAENVIKSNLTMLDSYRRQMRNANNKTKKQLKIKANELRRDTAAWLANLGQFEAAKQLAVSTRQRRIYRDYLEAERRDNSEWCEHPIFDYVDGHLQQKAFREFDFDSPRHGRRLSMVRCNECGFRNAKDLNRELKTLSEFREKVTSLVKDVPVEQQRQILTQEKLIKTNLEEVLK